MKNLSRDEEINVKTSDDEPLEIGLYKNLDLQHVIDNAKARTKFGKHSQINHILKRSYKSLYNVRKPSYKSISERVKNCDNIDSNIVKIPDLIIELDSEDKPIALEIKSSMEDLNRAETQCKFYYLEGFKPYIVLPFSLYTRFKDTINKIFNDIGDSKPGILIVFKRFVSHIQDPKY